MGSAYANTFTLPHTNSEAAYQLLEQTPGGGGDVDQIVFRARTGTIAGHAAAITRDLAGVARLPEIAAVTSPICPSATACTGAGQVSHDGRIAYAVVHFAQPGFKLSLNQIQAVENAGAAARSSSLQVEFGGNAFGQLDSPRGSRGEVFGLLAAAVVLVLAFGSLLAMLLPLFVALFALGVAAATTELLSHGLAIAQFAPILGSLIGLGVGIDYALFIVTRSRQGLKRGMSVEDAVVTAVDTSGRAVLFAGVDGVHRAAGHARAAPVVPQRRRGLGHADRRDHDAGLAHAAAGDAAAPRAARPQPPRAPVPGRARPGAGGGVGPVAALGRLRLAPPAHAVGRRAGPHRAGGGAVLLPSPGQLRPGPQPAAARRRARPTTCWPRASARASTARSTSWARCTRAPTSRR